MSSGRQPEEHVLFSDRNLGKRVIAERLRAAGMKVEIHDDHLPLNAPDETWIALVGRKRWVALTKDKNIRFRSPQLESIRKHAARIVVVRAKNATGPQIAEAVLKGRKQIKQILRFASRTTPPFVARIDRAGSVKPYAGVL